MATEDRPPGRDEEKPFWSTPAGITAIATLLGAVGGLLVVLNQVGVIGDGDGTATDPVEQVTTTEELPVTEPPPTTTTEATPTTEPPPTTTTEPPPTEPALVVFVESDPKIFSPEVDWTAFGYVFTTTLGQVGAPPSSDCRTWHSWAQNLGAADSGDRFLGTRFQLSLTASEGPVLIDGFDVEVIRRDPPIHGVHVVCPVGGADLDPRRVEIDLDSDPPKIGYLRDPRADESPGDLTISLSPGEIEIFEVWAFTDNCDCEWIAKLNYVLNGERDSVEISNAGTPFRTSGTRNAEGWLWDSGTRDWTPSG